MNDVVQRIAEPGVCRLGVQERRAVTILGRRRFAALAILLSPITLASALGLPLRAHAAGPTLPHAVGSLDEAAMALFDAAEAADWAEAEQALARAKTAALEANDLQSKFIAANGAISRFIEAQNNLGADLIEAGTALSVRDQRWLVSSADRIESRAGELSQPFIEHADALVPRIETLLFLARRMRRALVWHDDGGYRQASDSFRRIAASLRGDLGKRSPEGTRALELALHRVGDSPSRANLKSLYAAILRLRDAAPCQVDCRT
ncbi:MAG: hypothetical protein M3Z29_11430 [Pseudomonadota bacterium]|nr:hypothetical protein [Pseudomonadota bacterium]